MSDAASASASPFATPFDRRAVRRHRDRAAAGFAQHSFLHDEVAARLADRVDDINRGFPCTLILGGGASLAPHLAGRGGIETLIQADLSPAMAAQGRHLAGGLAVAADEEALPFAEGRFDLVLSLLSLHWVNDLPGALIQINRCLKPDGLLLAAMPGGDTLRELRRALLLAESEVEGGASPRVAPFVDVRDGGALLQRAGFALPVADLDTITVRYADPLTLWRDLRGMGESNALRERRKSFSRSHTLARAAAHYQTSDAPTDGAPADGRVPATFQILFLTGWAPAASQPKPLRPGSATSRLADALGTIERPAGESSGEA